jgi:D-aminopeptidase
VEEAVLNALVAARSVPTVKPAGRVLEAIDHEQLKDVLRRYGRLS